MQLIRARRLAAGLAVASVVLVVAPAPASAAPRAADVSMYVTDVTVPVGAETGTRLSTYFWATGDVVLQQPTVTYQLVGGLSGVTIEAEEGIGTCQNESPTKLVCASPFPFEIGPDIVGGYYDGFVKAGDDIVVGESGTVRTTLSARGRATITHDARVRVAESIDLTAGPEQRATAAPGASFDQSVVVSNTGDKVVTGASVVFDNDFAIEPMKRYRNCLYSDDRLRSCTFDQALAVGKSYAAVLPTKVRADTVAPGRAHGFSQWLTPAELEDRNAMVTKFGGNPGTPGTGDALTLIERSDARKVVQGDPNPDDNWGALEVSVTGTNGVDLAAVGAELTGAVGDEIAAPVGVRNVGTATLDRSRLGSPAAVTAVTVPDGTTVVGAPDVCYPEIDGQIDYDAPGKPGATKYECYSDYVFVAGTEEIYEFGLRIDRISGRAGLVAVNEPCQCEVFQKDIDKSNNKAPIVLTAGPGGGTGGGDDGDGDDDGGGLPVTGPAGVTIAGAGAALLVLGVGAFVLARRRRDTFVS